MWLDAEKQQQEQKTEKTIPVFSPVRIALAALVLLTLGAPSAQSGFQAPLSFDAGSSPYAVAVGDLNGDGIPDLAVANAGGSTSGDQSTVSISLGKGDGTFGPPTQYAAGRKCVSIALGDFNRDGFLDLAVANNGSGSVSVLLGNGDGTFQTAVDYRTGTLPCAVVVADFNGDGILDLAVANQGPGTVSLLLGAGDGTFLPAVNYQAGSRPSSVAVGDFNGDGHPDLVAANQINNGTVSVLLGNGDGTFQAAQNYSAGGIGPSSVAVGDFNGDGTPDLAVAMNNANNPGNTVSILLGNGDGTFQAPQAYTAGTNPASVTVADLNGDGVLDLAVSNAGYVPALLGSSVSVLLGKGDGTFLAAQDYAVGWAGPTTPGGSISISSVAVGDFNGDGKPDLAVANGGGNNVSVLLGKGDGTFPAAPRYSAGMGPYNLVMGDFNRDGISDLAVVNPVLSSDVPGTVSILLGNGDGTFQTPVDYPVGLKPVSVAVGDLNGDGILDLVVANFHGRNLSVLLGNGDGTFQAAVDYRAGDHPGYMTVADLNRDGILDVVVANQDSNNVSVLLGNGDGTFRAAVNYAAGSLPQSVAVGDFNGDGNLDLVVANLGSLTNGQGSSVAVLLGNGDGTFQAAVKYSAGVGPFAVAVGDLNGDGVQDLAVVNGFSNDVSVLLGKGDGTFGAAVPYAIGPETVTIAPLAMKDMNGDGSLDLVLLSGSGVRVFLGIGDGTFSTTPISYLAGVGPSSLVVGDFNGDGLPDVAVANHDPDGGVSVLINDGKWMP